MSTLLKERSTYWVKSGGSSASSNEDYRAYWKIYYDQEIANNRTKLTIDYYVQTYGPAGEIIWTYGSKTANCKVNGTNIGSVTISYSDGTSVSNGLHKKGTKTAYVNHNADGTATFTWQGSGAGLNTAVSTYTLPTIPRYATCSQSLSAKSEDVIKMSWSSDSTIDYVWYSKDGGSNWVGVGNPNATSGSYTISGLSPSTSYNIKTRVRRADSQLTTDSSALTVSTIARPSQTVTNVTETSARINWSTSSNASHLWYSTDNGSSWTDYGTVSGTNGYFDISLSPNTPYNIKIKATISATNTTYSSGSSATSITTYAYPYASNSTDFVIGNGAQVTIKNPLGRTYTCTLYGADGSEIGYYNGSYNGVLNAEFKTTDAIDKQYKSIPNDASGTYTIKVVYGNNTATRTGGTYSVNESENRPTFGSSDFTIKDVNEKTLNLTQNENTFIKGYSNVRVTVNNNAVAKNYASMEYYIINGVPYAYADSFATNENNDLKNITENSVKIFAKDTRGFSPEQPAEQPVIFVTNTNGENYFNITKKDNQSYVRSNQGVGEQVTFSFEGTWWNGNFGAVANALEASYEIYNNKTKLSTTGTTAINIATNGNKYSFSGVLYGDTNNGFDIESSYNVSITIKDKLSEATFTYVVIEGSPAIALYGNCVALGGPYNKSLGGRVQINGEKYSSFDINKVYPVGSIYMSVNSTNPSTLFGGTWEQIKDKFILSAGSTYTGGSTGGSASQSVDINHTHKISSHTHTITHAHTMSHTHSVGVASHTHSLGDAGYAKIQHNNGKFWFKEIDVATWVDSGSATASGTTNATNNAQAVPLGGSTGGVNSGSGTVTSGGSSASKTGNTDTANTGGSGELTSGNASKTSVTVNTLPPYLAVYVWKRTK